MKNSLSRRQFFATTALGVAALSLGPTELLSPSAHAAQARSRVVLASHLHLVDISEQINEALVRTAIEEALIVFTETMSIQDAWLRIFPQLQSSDVIGIKVNCINRRLASHPQVVYGIAQSLEDALGVNPNNIIIWDRTGRELKRANYNHSMSAQGVRCFGTSDGIGYDHNVSIDVGHGKRVHVSKILTEMCSYLINVPVLKDHGIAGLTISLKNHYGSIDRPGSCHGNACDPYLAHLNNAAPIKDKTALILCDALFGLYRGGPMGSPQWINRQIIVSTDPVALDTVGMDVIDQQRQAQQLERLADRVRYLRTAAQIGLGQASLEAIDVIEATLG